MSSNLATQVRRYGPLLSTVAWPADGFPDTDDNRWSLMEWYAADDELLSGWIAATSNRARQWVQRCFGKDVLIVHCYDANPNPGDVAIVIP
jgi:hypothetical protein